GSRFEIGGVTVGLYADRDGEGHFASLAVRVDGARIVIAASDQDSFAARLIGDRELSMPFPLGIQWSSRHGFELALAPGPLGVPGSGSLGPVRLDNFGLALASNDREITATVGARVTASLGPATVIFDRLGGELKLDRSTKGVLGLGALHVGGALPT